MPFSNNSSGGMKVYTIIQKMSHCLRSRSHINKPSNDASA